MIDSNEAKNSNTLPISQNPSVTHTPGSNKGMSKVKKTVSATSTAQLNRGLQLVTPETLMLHLVLVLAVVGLTLIPMSPTLTLAFPN